MRPGWLKGEVSPEELSEIIRIELEGGGG